MKRDSNCIMNDGSDEDSVDGIRAIPEGQNPPSWYSRLSTERSSLVLLVISAASYSMMGCFVKLLTATSDMSAIEIVFVRAVVQMFVVVTAMFFFTIPVPKPTRITDMEVQQSITTDYQDEPLIKHPLGLTKEIAQLCIIRGICGGSGFCLYFYTISVLPLGDAITILSLSPVVTVMIAPVILKEPMTKVHLGSAVLSVLGSICLARPPFLFGNSGVDETIGDNETTSTTAAMWGYLSGVLGACTGAGVYVLLRKAGKKGVHTLNLLFSWCVAGLFFSTVILIMNGSFVWPTSSQTWLYLLGSCLFGMMAHFILNFSARLAPAGIASIIRSSGIIWSYVLEVLVFHQVPQAWTIFGVGLVLASLGVIALEKHQEATAQQPHEHVPLATSEEEAEEMDNSLQLQPLRNSKLHHSADGIIDNDHHLHHRRNGSLEDDDDIQFKP
jgi:drug/metabolite transporter (DMT)-like permease